MLPAVDLDDKSRRQACEVDDVTADWYFSAEPMAGQTPATKLIPEFPFRVRHVSS
jgi:hypothetical protein